MQSWPADMRGACSRGAPRPSGPPVSAAITGSRQPGLPTLQAAPAASCRLSRGHIIALCGAGIELPRLSDARSSSLLMRVPCLADRGCVWPGAGWHVLPVAMAPRVRLSASGCPPLPAGDWCSPTSSGCPAAVLAFSLFLTILITPSPCFHTGIMQ